MEKLEKSELEKTRQFLESLVATADLEKLQQLLCRPVQQQTNQCNSNIADQSVQCDLLNSLEKQIESLNTTCSTAVEESYHDESMGPALTKESSVSLTNSPQSQIICDQQSRQLSASVDSSSQEKPETSSQENAPSESEVIFETCPSPRRFRRAKAVHKEQEESMSEEYISSDDDQSNAPSSSRGLRKRVAGNVEKPLWMRNHMRMRDVSPVSCDSDTSVSQPKKSRRRLWTQQEAYLVFVGFRKHGTQWHKIRDQYFRDGSRTGVNIKDKWRTMKDRNEVDLFEQMERENGGPLDPKTLNL